MQFLCRNRRRFSKRLRPRRTAVIALALTVLMSLQIATTTVARLLWPAHTHAVVDAQPRVAKVDSSCRLSGACAHATTLAHTAMFPHPDHLRQWLAHADAHLPVRTSRHTPPAEAGPGNDETAWPEHSHIKDLTHALAHAAGVGHHRHALGTVGVVYVDDDTPQLPTKLLIRSSDIILLLPSAHLLLPVPERAAAAPPDPPSVPLIAQYSLPGDRPPR